MDYLTKALTDKADEASIRKILKQSLNEDLCDRESHKKLLELGLEPDKVIALLAQYKSGTKYGYEISPVTPSALLEISRKSKSDTALRRLLLEYPVFMMKACWLYEHAPYFFFCSEDHPSERDFFILEFAEKYESDFLKNKPPDTLRKVKNPWRVKATTFWESKTFDPVDLVQKAAHDNIEGIEISVDFHPFNYTTLLPEEISKKKRQQIRDACEKSGVRIDIHSPIIGPYAPSPDPSRGKQLFFDPYKCLEIQKETIELARDIGAGAVVIHLIDTSNLNPLIYLIERARGSDVRVTIENYCQTREKQTSEKFISYAHKIYLSLPSDVRDKNFGITLDLGHLNIEGEDPLIGSERIGSWCLENHIFLRVHATDNYGDLLFSPPAYSADVHGNVSGRGINSPAVINLLRSMGHQFDVVAEQIQPLTPKDISTIHEAQIRPIDKDYEAYVQDGKQVLSKIELGALVDPNTIGEKAYQFLAGIKGVQALKEHLVFRKIQDKKHLSVDEAKRISQDFMRMPRKLRDDLPAYIDDLLLPIQGETGAVQKSQLDLICQNISGALFGTISNEHLNQIFSKNRTFKKGHVICNQGSAGQEMYFIKEGKVKVYINGSSVACLGPGEIFGEMSLFYNIKRSATIKAEEEKTELGVLTRKDLENLFKNSKPFAHDLIYRLYKLLPERLRNLNDKYKTAIRALYVFFNGFEKDLPSLEQAESKVEQEKADFFPTLSKEELKQIYQEERAFEAEQPIFAEGDKGDGAYFIIEGKVKVIGLSPHFEEVILGELGEGEIFGEMALIDEKPRSASVVTITPCRVAFIDKKDFNEFIEVRSELALRLMGFICLSIFRRILRLDMLYSNIKKKMQDSSE